MPSNDADVEIYIIVFIALLGLWYYLAIWRPFKKRLEYLRMELDRSFETERIELYNRKIKENYRKLIPFYSLKGD